MRAIYELHLALRDVVKRDVETRPLAEVLRGRSELKRGLEQVLEQEDAREDRDRWREVERAFREAK
jgi:hypothetical protein